MERQEKLRNSVLYRGIILHEITLLESDINSYIAAHFCGNDISKTMDMVLLFLGDERTTFSNKAQIFYYLAIHYDAQWYAAYISTRPKLPKKDPYSLNQDLVDAIEQRNVFAHRLVMTNIDGGEEPFTVFLKLKNEATPIFYTDENIDSLVEQIKNIRNHLNQSEILKKSRTI